MRIDDFLVNQRVFIDPSSSIRITPKVLGFCLEVDEQIVINYGYEPLLKFGDGGVGIEVHMGQYHPILIDSQHVGLSGLPNFSINMKWYDKGIKVQVLVESWYKYKELFNFDKIISFLICRDAIILKEVLDSRARILPMPSWDVCLLLPYYLKLCEEIPRHEFKYRMAGELGDQIKNVCNKIYKISLNNQHSIPYADLDVLLRLGHSLLDELRLANKLKDLDYDIRFGDPKSEPDYLVNDIPIEHKSKFPEVPVSSVKEVRELRVSEINGSTILNNLIRDLHEPDVGLKYKDGTNWASAYFDNQTRMPSALDFWGSVKFEKFDYYKHGADLNKTMHDSISLIEKEECIIPYVSPICSDPRFFAFPLSLSEYNRILGIDNV